jgi:predicted DNA-binding transcriptional regulator YafY
MLPVQSNPEPSTFVPMPADASPTARALRALEALGARPGIRAAELADHLGVTERAARRYVAILREAGIRIGSARGRYGGYRLGRGVRVAPVIFTEAQALSLVMAVLEAGAAGAYEESVLGAGMDKVISVLPEAVRVKAGIVWQHASGASDRSALRPDPAAIAALVAASAERQRVHIAYTSGSGASWEEHVDPWAVVTRHGYWYLLCRSHRAATTRAYRIDRVGGVAPTARSFEPPEHLDAVAELEEHLGRGCEFQTTVSFDAPCDEVARWIRPPMGRLELSEHDEQPHHGRKRVVGAPSLRLPGRRRCRASRSHGPARISPHRRRHDLTGRPSREPPTGPAATAT